MGTEAGIVRDCATCGHGYGSHWGYFMRNPCHYKNCNCADYCNGIPAQGKEKEDDNG
jgi:hypothetical protein